MANSKIISRVGVLLIAMMVVGCARDGAKGVNSGKDIPKPATKAQ
jgi:hypothetical protein